MHAAENYLRAYVEPGELPKRARFYAERRELGRLGAGRAFIVGVTIGCACTCIGVILIAVFVA